MPNRKSNLTGRWPVALVLAAAAMAPAEEPRKEAPPAYGPAVDQDPAMLIPPDDLAGSTAFTIAKTPPRVTSSTMTGLPTLYEKGLWCVWGEGLCASTGRFYVGVGDHRGVDGNCYVYEYDPATHAHRQVINMASLIGQRPGDFGHGKLHGRFDETPDGWMYMATYWGEYPDGLPPMERARVAGRLVRYNVITGRTEDLGAPMLGESWPMHATDTRRGVFHAIGVYGNYLAYDLRDRRVLYAGRLPGDITWHFRATLVDPKTGRCYGSEVDTRRIVEYDPQRNAFRHTRAMVPEHPKKGADAKHWIRSYTPRRLKDGSFIVQTYDGVIFKFFPDEERTEFIGLNWGDGLYSTSIALSPDDKYAYLAVGAHGQTWEFGSPLLQLNTQTYERKVLAFLHPYYQRKHGYVFGGSYSVCLDAKGENLLITWNGRFRAAQEEGESFGHPSFMYLEIPKEER